MISFYERWGFRCLFHFLVNGTHAPFSSMNLLVELILVLVRLIFCVDIYYYNHLNTIKTKPHSKI